MYASIAFHASIEHVLHYHEQKVSGKMAECIAAENFVKDREKLSFADKLYPFSLRASYNDRGRKKVFHSALMFTAEEKISNEDMAGIARAYMRGMGFGEDPYLVYRHHDGSREHAHLVSSRIDREGNWRYISRRDFYQSQAISQRLTREWGLQAGPPVVQSIARALEKKNHGVRVFFPAMNRILEAVIPHYTYTNLAELNAILREHRIAASRGNEGTLTFERRGLHFHPLQEDGSLAKEYIAARRFAIRPTYANLEKRFAENLVTREKHRESLAILVEYTLAGSGLSLSALGTELAKKKVSLVDGRGATAKELWFVDHRHQTVFSGEALGPRFSVGALQERLISDEAYRQRQELQKGKHHRHRHSF